MNKNPAEFRLLLRYSIRKDGEWFIVSNDVLDVVTQGESVEEALANFREAATLFVESCHRRGTLYDVLNQSARQLSLDARESEEDTMEILTPLVAREKTGVETRPN